LEYFPEMIGVPNSSDDWYMISPTSLIPIFHKAIQELSAEKEELKSRIFHLESLVSQLIAIVDPSIN